MTEFDTKAGFIALIGRPNVGKSTLLNCLLGEKISITSRKPQTTRHQILGIHSDESSQLIFIDTPGIHQNEQKALNRYMNKAARSVIADVDIVLHLIEQGQWTDEDKMISALLKEIKQPCFLVINKIDLCDHATLAKFMSQFSKMEIYDELIPLSAKQSNNTDRLLELLKQQLPESPFLFPSDQRTDKSLLFQTAEIIREKLMNNLHKELPYASTVQIEKYEASKTLDKIYATIWVERESQKGIVIGKKGETLKRIGEQVRRELEAKLKKKIFIQLWVKVKDSWSDKEASLNALGYSDQS